MMKLCDKERPPSSIIGMNVKLRISSLWTRCSKTENVSDPSRGGVQLGEERAFLSDLVDLEGSTSVV